MSDASQNLQIRESMTRNKKKFRLKALYTRHISYYVEASNKINSI